MKVELWIPTDGNDGVWSVVGEPGEVTDMKSARRVLFRDRSRNQYTKRENTYRVVDDKGTTILTLKPGEK